MTTKETVAELKLPSMSNELYEMYPVMSAFTHADAVNDYAKQHAAALQSEIADLQQQVKMCRDALGCAGGVAR